MLVVYGLDNHIGSHIEIYIYIFFGYWETWGRYFCYFTIFIDLFAIFESITILIVLIMVLISGLCLGQFTSRKQVGTQNKRPLNREIKKFLKLRNAFQ